MFYDESTSENAHFGNGKVDRLKNEYHFFSIGIGSECYTIVLQGDIDEATAALEEYFTRVKHLRTEYKERRDWHGTRRLGDCIIKACYFSGVFAPRRTKPLVEPVDMQEVIG